MDEKEKEILERYQIWEPYLDKREEDMKINSSRQGYIYQYNESCTTCGTCGACTGCGGCSSCG